MYTCEWCPDVQAYRETAFNQTPEKLNLWLKSQGYTYLVIDGRAVRKWGPDDINKKAQELINAAGFTPVQQSDAFLLFKIE